MSSLVLPFVFLVVLGLVAALYEWWCEERDNWPPKDEWELKGENDDD